MIDATRDPTTASSETPAARARVTSDTPGRMRLRLKRDHQQPQLLHSVKRRIEHAIGPGHVEVNPTTHSVLVRYDRDTHTSSAMLGLLRDLGVIVEETARALGEDLSEVAPGRSTTSVSIIDAMNDLDRRLARWTGRQLDLKLLFPLTLGGLGVLQLARRGVGLGDVPAYVLIWYAFDSFWKFHSRTHGDPRP